MDIRTVISPFGVLPEEAHNIRKAVFLDEQGFEKEFDETDGKAYHILMYSDNSPAAVCRLFGEGKTLHIGRFAVAKEFRGTGMGRLLIDEAHRLALSLGADTVELSAQISASGFYKKMGYETVGDEYLDEFCPHILMRKSLQTNQY